MATAAMTSAAPRLTTPSDLRRLLSIGGVVVATGGALATSATWLDRDDSLSSGVLVLADGVLVLAGGVLVSERAGTSEGGGAASNLGVSAGAGVGNAGVCRRGGDDFRLEGGGGRTLRRFRSSGGGSLALGGAGAA
jgi:hypothetical protein